MKNSFRLRCVWCILGFVGLGGVLPDEAGGLGVEELVPQAAADQVGPLGQVEHAPLCRHCDAASLHPTHHHKLFILLTPKDKSKSSGLQETSWATL